MDSFRSVYFGAVWIATVSTIIRLIERNDTDCPICYMPLQGVMTLKVAPSVQMPAHLGNGKPMPSISRNIQTTIVSDEGEKQTWSRTPLITRCGHTFCRTCILNWMLTCCDAQSPKWTIPCPICRTEVLKVETFNSRCAIRTGLSYFNKAIAAHRRPLRGWERIEEMREIKESTTITAQDRQHHFVRFDRARFLVANRLALRYIRHLHEVAHDFDNERFCPIALKGLDMAWSCVHPQVLGWVEATLVRPCPFEPKNSVVGIDALFNTIKSCMAISLFCKDMEASWSFSADDCKLTRGREYQEFAHSLQQKKVWWDFVICFQVTIGLLKSRDDPQWSQASEDMFQQTFGTSFPEA